MPNSGFGAVVHGAIQIGEVGLQSTELRVIGVDDLAGLGIGVTMLFGIDRLLEPAIEVAEHDAGISNRLQRVPGHHHLGRGIRAELQMQAGDRWCRHRIGRRGCDGCTLRGSASDEGRRHGGPSKGCGGEQRATTEFEVEFDVRCGHRGEVAPQCSRHPIATRRQHGKPAADQGSTPWSLGPVGSKLGQIVGPAGQPPDVTRRMDIVGQTSYARKMPVALISCRPHRTPDRQGVRGLRKGIGDSERKQG